MGASWAYRSVSDLLYTCMIEIVLAAFLIAPAHLIPRLVSLSCISFAFFSIKLALTTLQVLPPQTASYRYDE